MSILTLEHCSHSFGGRSIFEDVSFRLLKGEHVGLLGANGEGKSTFMKIITRKLEPVSYTHLFFYLRAAGKKKSARLNGRRESEID